MVLFGTIEYLLNLIFFMALVVTGVGIYGHEKGQIWSKRNYGGVLSYYYRCQDGRFC
jgi:hypothetical protein